MRVAHAIFGLSIGGAETMLVDVAREQSAHAEVSLIVVNADFHESVVAELPDRVRFATVGRPVSSRNPWYALKLSRLLRRIAPDIIHIHDKRVIDMLPFSRVPMVVTVHHTRDSLPRSVRRYRKVFAISEAVRDDLLDRYPGLDPTVVHDGVAFSRIGQKERYGGKPFRAVQIGRLDHAIKGQDILIEALKHVNQKRGPGALIVDFIGQGESRKFLEDLAARLGVGQWCRFLGMVTRRQVYEMLPTYDLLVQPSRYEGFGLTVVEAMAARVPVLVSGIEGPMEIIDKGRFGFSFRKEDPEDCGNRIMEIMDLSQEQGFGRRMNEACEYGRSRFDISLTAQAYLEEYGRVVSLGAR